MYDALAVPVPLLVLFGCRHHRHFLVCLIPFIILCSSSTVELKTSIRHFTISVPDVVHANPQEEEYICTVQYLNLREEAIYLEEFVYDFPKEGSAHHFLLYGCKSVAKYALENQYWVCNVPGTSSICFQRKFIPLGIPQNNSAKFPDNVAYGVGPLFEINYLMLEVHFKAEMKNDLSNSTALEASATNENRIDSLKRPYISRVVAHGSTLRPKYLAGMMVMAGVGFRIPLGQKNFSVNINCQPDLSQPIQPYAYWVHTHNLGEVVSGYKISKTSAKFTEIARWTNRRPQPVVLDLKSSNSAVAIFPGDYVAAKCTYDSSNTTTDVYWGPRHNFDEMCNLFLFYYTLSKNLHDLSIPCVNEKSKYISKHFPQDAYTLPEWTESQTHNIVSNINPICDLYRQFKINDCPFI